MLSVFSLKDVLTESAMYGSAANVEAYNFIGDLDESTFIEANYEIMAEAASMSEFVTISDETMVESVIGGVLTESEQAILSENVFEQIFAGIKKFFEKVISVVKGLINKLKAFFYKFTGKTDKWVSVMRKPIEEAEKRGKNARDFKYMLHKWDEDYIISKMSSGVEALIDGDKADMEKSVKEAIDFVTTGLNGYKGKKADDPDIKKKIEVYEKEVKSYNEAKDAADEDLCKDLAAALSVSGNSIDAVWGNVETKAMGDEKTDTLIMNNAKHMLEVIEKSKTTISNLEKAYKNYLEKLNKIKGVLDKADSSLKDVEKEVPSVLVSAGRQSLTAEFDFMKHSVNITINAINTTQSKNLKYVQSMVSEYMSALSKFANVKASKEK